MAPQTRNSSKPKDSKGAKNAGITKATSANGPPSADRKARRAKVQADIATLEENLQATSENDPEKRLYESQLEVRKAELALMVDDQMEVDSEVYDEPIPETQTAPDDRPHPSVEFDKQAGTQPASDHRPVDEDEDGLLFSLTALTVNDYSDVPGQPAGWRWTSGRRKQVIMRLGTPQRYTFVWRTHGESYLTKGIQRISGLTVLDHRNDEGKLCYGTDNIAGFRGVVIYTTQAQQHIYFLIQYRNLNQGLPPGLIMEKERCWETRTKLLRLYDPREIDGVAKALWARQEERYSQLYNEQRSTANTPGPRRSATPFPAPPPVKKKEKIKSATRQRQSKPIMASDSESVSESSNADRDRSSSATSRSGSEPVGTDKSHPSKGTRHVKQEPDDDALFMSPRGNHSMAGTHPPLRFSKTEFMRDAMARANIGATDYQELAKLEAAYKVYRHHLLKQGAEEVPDTEALEEPTGVDEIL